MEQLNPKNILSAGHLDFVYANQREGRYFQRL